jgi:hypothetical protein
MLLRSVPLFFDKLFIRFFHVEICGKVTVPRDRILRLQLVIVELRGTVERCQQMP